MLRSVFTKWLWDSRRSLLGWTLAVLAVGCGYAAFWPTMDNPDLQALLESYPAAILEALNYTDIASAAGYLSATVYGLVVALLLVVFAVTSGTRTIAGDEDAGTLDLVLAHPVSRASVAVQRFGAFCAAVVLIVLAFGLAMLAISGPAQFDDISAARMAAMHLHLAMFVIMFGAIAFGVGAATGSRGAALAVGAAAAVIAYAASGILPQVEGLEWVKEYSAFTWLTGSQPLANGVDVGHVLLMLGISAVLVVGGTVLFQRRDIAV